MPLPPSFIRNAVGNATRSLNLDAKKVVEGGIHLAILAASVAGTVESIRTDEWEVIRRKRSSAEAGGGGIAVSGVGASATVASPVPPPDVLFAPPPADAPLDAGRATLQQPHGHVPF